MECPNEVAVKLQNSGQVYCSRDCAPYGNFGILNPTLSAPKRGSFYTKASGTQSQPSESSSTPHSSESQNGRKPAERPTATGAHLKLWSGEGFKSVSTTEKTETVSTQRLGSEGRTGPKNRDELTQNETGKRENGDPNTGRCGMTGMQEIARDTASQRSQDETDETSPDRSVEVVRSLEQERSVTMSLIDDSARLLHDCMRTQIKNRPQDRPLDYREVHGIANLGKQIAQLAKVKLDAIREASKNS